MVLTSPPYNTAKGSWHEGNRYDVMSDGLTTSEYCDWTVGLFHSFDRILKPNGVIAYNLSYSTQNTDGMFMAVDAVIQKSNFSVADVIVWKKASAFPNNQNPNRLTRTFEFVFIFARKNEMDTFRCNKRVVSTRPNGQKEYENLFNFIVARNNDGSNPYNKATFSTDFAMSLLRLYAPKGGVVYDPFMGTGTTAVACKEYGCSCYGSEISAKQCQFAEERLGRIHKAEAEEELSLFDYGRENAVRSVTTA